MIKRIEEHPFQHSLSTKGRLICAKHGKGEDLDPLTKRTFERLFNAFLVSAFICIKLGPALDRCETQGHDDLFYLVIQ